MSQIARVFVVLNLLLAAGFFFAASTFLGLNNDYKGKLKNEVEAHKKTADANQVIINKQKDDIARLEGSNRALTEQRGNLEGVTATQKTSIESLEKSLAEKDRQLAEASRINNEHATNVNKMQGQVAELTTTNTSLDAQKREAVDNMTKAQEDLNKANQAIVERDNKIADQEKAIAKAMDTIKSQELVIDYAKQMGVSVDDVFPAPALNGAVVNADNSMKLVQVNIGAGQGVKRGHTLDIVRGGQYVGRMRVDQVFDSSAAGTLTVSTGNNVMAGDRVTNRL